jgi:hypothetical protein
MQGFSKGETFMGSNNQVIWKGAVSGALAGFAASWVMNEFQSLWTKTAKEFSDDAGSDGSGSGDESATAKVASTISHQLFSHELSEDEKKWAEPAVHYGFGSLVGMVYGVMAAAIPFARVGYGIGYGSMVWLAADEVAVPAFGLSQSSKAPVSSHVKALASHCIYGLATDLAQRAMMKM